MAVERVTLSQTSGDAVRRQFGTHARREHLSLTETRTPTEWFLWIDEHNLCIGFGGIMLGKDVARLKALYVMPEFRGSGLGAAGAAALIEEARRHGYRRFDQYAIRPDWWITQGWRKVGKPRGNGAQYMVWED